MYIYNQKMQIFLQGTLAAKQQIKTKNLGDGGKCQFGHRYQSTIVPFKILKDL